MFTAGAKFAAVCAALAVSFYGDGNQHKRAEYVGAAAVVRVAQ